MAYSDFDKAMLAGGAGSLLGGLFGDSGAPYEAASQEYEKYGAKGEATQQPFYEAGVAAIPQFQNWLTTMQNPSDFLNMLMGEYQVSPYARYQQQQMLRAARNRGAASGLGGSTPLAQFEEEQARNIASQDMGNWLQRVLGINTQYGQGLNRLMTGGQTGANALTQLYGNLGQQLGEARYGQQAGEESDLGNLLGGATTLLGSLFL